MGLGCLSVLFIISHLSYLNSADARESICPPSFTCQTLGSLTFPFYDSTDKQCGLCNLNCGNSPPTIQLEEKGQPYDVIRSVASDEVVIHDQEFQRLLDVKSCDTFENIVFPSSPSISFIITYNITLFKCPSTLEFIPLTNDYYSYKCKEHTLYYRYPLGEDDPVPAGCSVIQLPLSVDLDPQRPDSSNLFKLLTADFSLQLHVSDDCIKCRGTGGQCQKHKKKFHCSTETGTKRRFFIAVAKVIACSLAGGLGITAVVALCCFRSKCSIYVSMMWRKDRKEGHTTVEAVLEQYGPLAATRYTYQDVKKMTNFFKYQLGQGGNGCVYKGVLHDGRFAAVKILNNLKADGEDFVNEVVSISRTSHINVVSLLGFCFEGSKRALIYEFMPNGSLDKFIYSNGKSSSTTRQQLGRQTLYQIALGIARGLEYLHRGCSTRILHFDIKPHNILLDEEFCPKIADFGLAKLCFGKDSIISMLGMRGTPGYIAPEVFSRNFGGVSHKSDVYSYGMMILEMVGGRKNSDQGFDHTSEKYFPQWIYNRLELDVEIGLSAISGEVESEKTRKMIMVGLWCIQTDPANRPSMRKVLDMLEGSLEVLQIPSKPFLVSSPECYSTTQASQ